MLNKRCAFEGNTPVRGYGSLPAQDGISLPAGCADRSKAKNPATQTECAEVLRFQKTEVHKMSAYRVEKNMSGTVMSDQLHRRYTLPLKTRRLLSQMLLRNLIAQEQRQKQRGADGRKARVIDRPAIPGGVSSVSKPFSRNRA